MVFESFNFSGNSKSALYSFWRYSLYDSKSRIPRENSFLGFRWNLQIGYLCEFHRLLRSHFFILKPFCVTIFFSITESENIENSFFVSDKTRFFEHLSHIKFTAVPMTSVHFYLRTPLCGGWVATTLEGLVNIKLGHPDKIYTFNNRVSNALIRKAENYMLIFLMSA